MEGGWAIVLVAAVTLLVNLPLGRLRTRYRRFSTGWFVAVHASIPLIVALRILLHISWGWAPAFVGLAVLGQFLGPLI